jgi:hypothetical protein
MCYTEQVINFGGNGFRSWPLKRGLYDSPQVLQASARILLGAGHDRFLLNHLKLIINLSFYKSTPWDQNVRSWQRCRASYTKTDVRVWGRLTSHHCDLYTSMIVYVVGRLEPLFGSGTSPARILGAGVGYVN